MSTREDKTGGKEGGGKREEGRGRERRSFPPVARNWITSVLIWRDVIHEEKEGERGILGGSQRKGERCMSGTHTGKKKKRTNDDMYREFGARHRNLFLSLRRTLH